MTTQTIAEQDAIAEIDADEFWRRVDADFDAFEKDRIAAEVADEIAILTGEVVIDDHPDVDVLDLLRAEDDGMIEQEPSIVGRVGALAKVMGLGATLAVTAMVGSASARGARLTDAQAAHRVDMALSREFPGRTVEAQCHVGQQVHCVVQVAQ